MPYVNVQLKDEDTGNMALAFEKGSPGTKDISESPLSNLPSKSLINKLEWYKGSIDELENRIKGLEDLLQLSERQKRESRKEVFQLYEDLKSKDDSHKNDKNMWLSEKKIIENRVLDDKKIIESQLLEYKNSIKELNSLLEVHKENHVSAINENFDLMKSIENLETKDSELIVELELKNTEIQRIIREKDTYIGQITTEKNAYIEQITTEKDAYIEQITTEKDAYIDNLKSAHELSLKEMSDEYIYMFENIKNESKTRLSATIKDYDDEINNIKNSNTKYISDIKEEHKNEIQKLQLEQEEKIESIKSGKDKEIEELTDLNTRILENEGICKVELEEGLRLHYNAIISNLKNVHTEETLTLEKQIESYKCQIEFDADEIHGLQNKVNSLESESENLKNTINRYQDSNTELNREKSKLLEDTATDKANICKLEANVTELEGKYTEIVSVKEILDEKYSVLEVEHGTLRDEYNSKLKQNGRYEKNIEELQIALTLKGEELMALASTSDYINSEIKILVDNNDSLRVFFNDKVDTIRHITESLFKNIYLDKSEIEIFSDLLEQMSLGDKEHLETPNLESIFEMIKLLISNFKSVSDTKLAKEDECKGLQLQISALNLDIEGTNRLNSELRENMGDEETKFADIIDKYRIDLEGKCIDLQNLSDRMNTLQNDLQHKEQEIELLLETKLKDAETHQYLIQTVDIERERVAILNCEKDQFIQERVELVEKYESKIEELNQANIIDRTKLERDNTSSINDKVQEIDSINKVVDALTLEINVLKEDLNLSKIDNLKLNEELQQQICEYESIKSKYKDEIAQLQDVISNLEIQKLDTKLIDNINDISKEKKQLESSIEMHIRKYNQLQSDTARVVAKYNILENEYNSLKCDNNNLNSSLSQMQQQLDSIDRNHKKSDLEKKGELDTKVNELLVYSEKVKEESDHKIQEYINLLDESKNENKQLKTDFESTKASLTKRISDLEMEISTSQSEILQYKLELQKIKDEDRAVNYLSQEIDGNWRTQLEMSLETIATQENDLTELFNKYNSISKENDELKGEMDKMSEQTESYNTEHELNKIRIEQYESKLESLVNSVENLERLVKSERMKTSEFRESSNKFKNSFELGEKQIYQMSVASLDQQKQNREVVLKLMKHNKDLQQRLQRNSISICNMNEELGSTHDGKAVTIDRYQDLDGVAKSAASISVGTMSVYSISGDDMIDDDHSIRNRISSTSINVVDSVKTTPYINSMGVIEANTPNIDYISGDTPDISLNAISPGKSNVTIQNDKRIDMRLITPRDDEIQETECNANYWGVSSSPVMDIYKQLDETADEESSTTRMQLIDAINDDTCAEKPANMKYRTDSSMPLIPSLSPMVNCDKLTPDNYSMLVTPGNSLMCDNRQNADDITSYADDITSYTDISNDTSPNIHLAESNNVRNNMNTVSENKHFINIGGMTDVSDWQDNQNIDNQNIDNTNTDKFFGQYDDLKGVVISVPLLENEDIDELFNVSTKSDDSPATIQSIIMDQSENQKPQFKSPDKATKPKRTELISEMHMSRRPRRNIIVFNDEEENIKRPKTAI